MVKLPSSITVTFPQLSKMIDHSLLQPTLTDAEIADGLEVAAKYKTATACVKPYSIPQAIETLKGSGVNACCVIGFPAGNSTTEVKVYEARRAAEEGCNEVDMVVNIGKVLGGQWDYVEEEIKAINDAVVAQGATLKVIFENFMLQNEHIIKLCDICTQIGVEFIKTSTGFGQWLPGYKGATLPHLELMRKHAGKNVKIKAAGGVRTLDELLQVMALGIDRVGASATVAILEEARSRGIGEEPVEVSVPPYKA